MLSMGTQPVQAQSIFSFLNKKGEYTLTKKRGKGKKMKCGYMNAYNKGRAYRKYKKTRGSSSEGAPTTYVKKKRLNRDEILAQKNEERNEALGIPPSPPKPKTTAVATLPNGKSGNNNRQPSSSSSEVNNNSSEESVASVEKKPGNRLTQQALKDMTEQQRRDTLARTTPTIVLPPIQFISDQDEFSVVNMDSFMKAMEYAQAGNVVLIEGHTDDLGRAQYNLDLSMKRSEKIRNLLLSAGVADELISVIGYGESQPKVPNTNDENRAINRRIEFKIFELAQ